MARVPDLSRLKGAIAPVRTTQNAPWRLVGCYLEQQIDSHYLFCAADSSSSSQQHVVSRIVGVSECGDPICELKETYVSFVICQILQE